MTALAPSTRITQMKEDAQANLEEVVVTALV